MWFFVLLDTCSFEQDSGMFFTDVSISQVRRREFHVSTVSGASSRFCWMSLVLLFGSWLLSSLFASLRAMSIRDEDDSFGSVISMFYTSNIDTIWIPEDGSFFMHTSRITALGILSFFPRIWFLFGNVRRRKGSVRLLCGPCINRSGFRK